MSKINFKKIFAAKPKQPVVLGQKTIPYRDASTKKPVGSITYYYMNSYVEENTNNVMVLVVGHITAGAEKDPNRKQYKFKSKAIMFNQSTGEWVDRNNNLTQSIEEANEQAKIVPDVYSLVRDKILDSNYVPFDAIMNYAKKGMKPKPKPKAKPKAQPTQTTQKPTQQSPTVDEEDSEGDVKSVNLRGKTAKLELDKLSRDFPDIYQDITTKYPEITNKNVVKIYNSNNKKAVIIFGNKQNAIVPIQYITLIEKTSISKTYDEALEYYENHKNEDNLNLSIARSMIALKEQQGKQLDERDKYWKEQIQKKDNPNWIKKLFNKGK